MTPLQAKNIALDSISPDIFFSGEALYLVKVEAGILFRYKNAIYEIVHYNPDLNLAKTRIRRGIPIEDFTEIACIHMIVLHRANDIDWERGYVYAPYIPLIMSPNQPTAEDVIIHDTRRQVNEILGNLSGPQGRARA